MRRYSLGFRLDPAIMAGEGETREVPYGVVFAHGRRFNGYHVRWRDIARGGLRIVTPGTFEQLALESGRQYDECYGLSFAQQMKNKDIPEGGSKAVCLVNSVGMSQQNKNFVMRKSFKAFTDTILDLIVDTEETNDMVKDYYGEPEVLYLGPDEQVIPEDLDWVIQRAKYREYVCPNAFMSSKPLAGINHKTYGVTSEGVNVFLDVALRDQMKIDPTSTPFTVKLTGGTDGDVCGNEILILYREYGDNAKVVGLCDHTGSLEDPNGLDSDELTRMVKASVPLSDYDTSKLSPEGRLHLVDNEEGLRMRNTMHNRVEADAFVPAGGRPNTIDINNWRQFLKEDGTPTSPLVVEGANLFITLEARKAMYEEAGIIIVTDSSANKCGVICSSYVRARERAEGSASGSSAATTNANGQRSGRACLGPTPTTSFSALALLLLRSLARLRPTPATSFSALALLLLRSLLFLSLSRARFAHVLASLACSLRSRARFARVLA
jgi:glutamate dehydrogenase